jgi:hypothetical protein
LGLGDLSPLNPPPEDHWLVVLKGYFDGGNQADIRRYDRVTLATICGTCAQWNPLESAWRGVLALHKAPFLHTTDAISLNKEFSKKKGWSDDKVNLLISDCVKIIADHLYVPAGTFPIDIPFNPQVAKQGVMAVTLTIPLDAYRKARNVVFKLPTSVTEICTSESLGFLFKWGRLIGAERYELYFDQGEPFFGHVYDRKHSKKARRQITLMPQVVHIGEVDMRVSPALQIADLFAWCINHNDDTRRDWHRRLNGLDWRSLILDYEHLVKPTPGALERTAAWNLPKRRVTP